VKPILAKARQEKSRPSHDYEEMPSFTSIEIPDQSAEGIDASGVSADQIVALKFDDPIANLFRVLRAQILRKLHSLGQRSLGITSARQGEGKTFTAVNLAASIALSQKQPVLLVDLDLKRPNVHNFFQTDQRPGLTDCVSGAARFLDCIRPTGINGLEVLSAGGMIRNSSEALGSPELARGFKGLREASPLLFFVFDLPPVLVGDDVLAVSPELDAILLVVEEGRTKLGEVQRVLDLIPRDKLVGTVLNKSRGNNPFPYSPYYGPK